MSLYLYSFLGLMMTQGQWKHVPILWKQWYCFYTRYFVLTFNYRILIN